MVVRHCTKGYNHANADCMTNEMNGWDAEFPNLDLVQKALLDDGDTVAETFNLVEDCDSLNCIID